MAKFLPSNLSLEPRIKLTPYKTIASLKRIYTRLSILPPGRFVLTKGFGYDILQHTSKNNRKIREYIIGRALYSVLPTSDLFTANEKLDYQEDPLGIAAP